MNKVRESNYELLRIVAMFFIVLWHVVTHGGLIQYTSGVLNFFMNVVVLFVIVHVNLFMLITGYFQSKSTFKLKKFISIILQIWFYNFTINTFLCLTGLIEYTNIDYLTKILFFNFSSYWYIQCYVIVYLLSPFVNKIIDLCSRKELKRLIIVMLFCFSIFPFITCNLFYSTNGFTVAQYILMYLIGAYIHKYNLDKDFLCRFNITQKRLIYLAIFFGVWIINVMVYYLQCYLSSLESNTLRFIASSLLSYKYWYSNPLVIIQAISLFLFFGTFQFKNNFINFISKLTLGVYLIHEALYIKENIYEWFGIYTGGMFYSKTIILKVVVVSLIIFIGCLLIEFFRQLLFKLLSKFKLIKKLDTKLSNFITNIIEIN